MVKVGYISGAEESSGFHAVLWCVAQSTRVDITSCGQHMRACEFQVVGGTALVKMTQPILNLDHSPNLRLGATSCDICHLGAPKLSLLPSKALPRCPAGLPVPDRESWPITEAEKHSKAPIRVVGIPGRICSASTGSEDPCPHHRTTLTWGQEERAVASVVGQWASPGIGR